MLALRRLGGNHGLYASGDLGWVVWPCSLGDHGGSTNRNGRRFRSREARDCTTCCRTFPPVGRQALRRQLPSDTQRHARAADTRCDHRHSVRRRQGHPSLRIVQTRHWAREHRHPGRRTREAAQPQADIKGAGSSATRPSSFRIPALPKPSLSIGDASVVEGNADTAALNFRISLSAPTPLTVTVRYATSDGTAIAESDYTAGSGSVTFKPRQTTALILVKPIGDSAFESDDSDGDALATSQRTLADPTATGRITNDDIAIRSGHYTGSTSQFTFIAFDVAEGGSALSGMFFFANLTCDTPLNMLRNVKIELLSPIPVGPEGSFATSGTTITPSQISITVSVEGKLTAPSSASGVVRVVDMTSNESPFRGAHCRSDVTWAAAAS